MSVDHCAGCGRAIAGGTAACRAEFEAACAFDYEGGVPYVLHRLTVDTYSLQHPDDFCASGKSLVAHLVGLLVWAEHDGRQELQRTLRDWIDGPREIDRPSLPSSRGALTLGDVTSFATPEQRAAALERWARATWDAHQEVHAIARRWFRAARTQGRQRC